MNKKNKNGSQLPPKLPLNPQEGYEPEFVSYEQMQEQEYESLDALDEQNEILIFDEWPTDVELDFNSDIPGWRSDDGRPGTVLDDDASPAEGVSEDADEA